MTQPTLEQQLQTQTERAQRAEDRLRELSLDVIQWWRVVFDTDWVHTKVGETPMQLAERAREELRNRGPERETS